MSELLLINEIGTRFPCPQEGKWTFYKVHIERILLLELPVAHASNSS
jgi:hypothetical protein